MAHLLNSATTTSRNRKEAMTTEEIEAEKIRKMKEMLQMGKAAMPKRSNTLTKKGDNATIPATATVSVKEQADYLAYKEDTARSISLKHPQVKNLINAAN